MKKIPFWPILSISLLAGLLYNAFLHGSDFHVFYLAGERIRDGLEIYLRSDGPDPFKYHPAWAVAFTSLTLLPETLAKVFFVAGQMALWWYGALRIAKIFDVHLNQLKSFCLLLLLALNPMSAETGYGQINAVLFMGAIFVVEWLEAEPQRPRLAGALIAILASLKLNFALFAVYALIKNRKSFFGFVYGLFALHVITALSRGDLTGRSAYGEWIYLLIEQSRRQQWSYEVQGFMRLFYEWLGTKYLWGWFSAIALVIGLGFWLHGRKPKTDKGAVLSFWLTTLFLVSPLAWWYQVILVYPLGLYLAFRLPRPWQRNVAWSCLAVFALGAYSVLGAEHLIDFKTGLGFFWPTLILLGLFVRFLWPKNMSPGRTQN